MTGKKMGLGLLGESFMYLYTGESSAVTRCNITLNEKVDPGNLLAALKETLGRYDIFRVKPYIDDKGNLVLKENPEEPRVYEFDGKRAMLGTKESAGYLFRVLYKENTVITEIFHGITDARGAWQFTQSILFEYVTRSFHSAKADDRVITSKTPREDTEGELLFERVLNDLKGAQKTDELKDEPAPSYEVLAPQSSSGKTGQTKRYMLTYDVSDALSLTRGMKVTITSLFLCVFARALYELQGSADDRCVVAEMPVDMRAMLKSRSLLNFSSNILIPFGREYLGKDIEEQAGYVSNTMRSQINVDNLYAGIGPYAEALLELVKLPVGDEGTICALQKQANEAGGARSSFMLSNVGVLGISDDLCDHVADVEFESESLKGTPEFVLYSYRDKGKIMMLWKDGDPSFMNAVQKILLEYGLKTEAMPEKSCVEDYVKPWNFERNSI
ncbi:MAG: hypothetical protein K6A38_08430 [Lachnospiraceae bacterium]|nr:hypothetical protein [Lachnospiraceae bacterium]